MSYAFYDLVGTVLGVLAVPFLGPLALTRHGRGLGERLGSTPAAVRALHRPVWVHAASVGEILAAEPLVEQLRRRRPELPVLVSTTTVTGRETARQRLRADAVMLSPVDLRWVVDRVMRRVRPRCLVIVETELWPALIRAAAGGGTPCLIVSGRVSERAARRYAWIRWLTRAVLSHVDVLAMQTDGDAARVIALGAPDDRVQVLGSLKLARGVGAPAARAAPDPRALLRDRVVLVAASTHAGEEAMVLDACAELWAAHPSLLLLIAPRRPERFSDVEHLIGRAGLRYERRTAVAGAVGRDTQVLLLDTLGELPNVLAAATAVFVGGTIAPIGGHNVLEPALFGRPVAFGPHTANVHAAATALLEAAAATRVHDAGELAAEWQRLLRQPGAADEMGARGRRVLAAGAAAAERTVELVCRHLTDA